jgi:hypothetical protein
MVSGLQYFKPFLNRMLSVNKPFKLSFSLSICSLQALSTSFFTKTIKKEKEEKRKENHSAVVDTVSSNKQLRNFCSKSYY